MSSGERSKALHRKRSERVERSFAHVCGTGRARRTWIRGVVEVCKRYTVQVAAYNLGKIMREVFGIGTPRSLQGGPGAALRLAELARAAGALIAALLWAELAFGSRIYRGIQLSRRSAAWSPLAVTTTPSSTGC